MRKHWMTFGPLILAATVVLTGCATIRQLQAPDTEQLLGAAGFTMQPASTPDQQPRGAMPPYRLVRRAGDGAVEYTYADPKKCKCVYVGGSKEYAQYQRLATQDRIARERLWADEQATPDFAYSRGPWW